MSNVYNQVCIALEDAFIRSTMFKKIPRGSTVCICEPSPGVYTMGMKGNTQNWDAEDRLGAILTKDLSNLFESDKPMRDACLGGTVLRR